MTIWKGLTVAGAAIAAFILFLVLVALMNRPSPEPSPGESDYTPAPTAPLGVQADMTWQDVGGVDVPVCVKDGPSNPEIAYGYSLSHRGAALAAVNILVRSSAALGPQTYRPVIVASMVEGPERERMLNDSDSWWQAVGGQVGEATGKVRGYVQDPQRPESVTVVLSGTDSATGVEMYVGFDVELEWTGTTWKAFPPEGGDWFSAAEQVDPNMPGLTAYV